MIIKFNPILMDKIWGGDKLKKNYGYQASDKCGECWGISCHPNGLVTVQNSEYKGRTLKDLFDNEKHLFGDYPGKEFPILVKIVSAGDNLSIQVHPDNEYAKRENSLGKEECWYILDAEKDTKIIIGHHAKTKEEFSNAIKDGSLENLCNEFSIKNGDYFYINTGKLHAICAGTTLLEVQQSSDITYRVYDYNRLQDGKPRPLHINQALDVTNIPDTELLTTHKNTYFNYEILENSTLSTYKSSRYGDYIFIIEGNGSFNRTPVQKGDFIMIPSNKEYKVYGNIKFQKTTF